MSKYIATRLETINTKLLALNDLNLYIESYIRLLKEIKKENNIFDIYINKITSDYNSSIYKYNIAFMFNFLSETHYLDIYSYDNIVSNPIFPEELKHIMISFISYINKKEKFQTICDKLKNSNNIFYQINEIYYEIHKKNGDFNSNSDVVINYFKEEAEKRIIINDNQYKYINVKPKKNHKMENIYFYKYKSIDKHCFQLIVPILKDIKKDENYIKTFKKEFIRLNQYFCEIFCINIGNIYSDLEDFTIFLRKEEILKLSQKIQLNEQIKNF